MPNQTNFVFIHLAHLRSDAFAFRGCASIKTPGFDYLSQAGAFYANAFNPLIHTKEQLRARSSFISDLAPRGVALTFWSSLVAKGYSFYESHFDSHPIDPREVGRQAVYPRIIQKDQAAIKVEAKTDKELARWANFIEKSDKPFVAHFTSDDLLAPFQAEQQHYDAVDSSLIPLRQTKERPTPSNNSIFGSSIWEENHWHEMRRTYLAQVIKIDSGIKYLVDMLMKHKKIDNTVIVVYGQGAPALGDFGFEITPTHELKESYIHVPLFIKYPESLNIPVGIQSKFVSLADIWPTLFELAGLSKLSTFQDLRMISLLNDQTHASIKGDLVLKSIFGFRKVARYTKTPQHLLVQRGAHVELYANTDLYGIKNLKSLKEFNSIIEQLKSL